MPMRSKLPRHEAMSKLSRYSLRKGRCQCPGRTVQQCAPSLPRQEASSELTRCSSRKRSRRSQVHLRRFACPFFLLDRSRFVSCCKGIVLLALFRNTFIRAAHRPRLPVVNLPSGILSKARDQKRSFTYTVDKETAFRRRSTHLGLL